MLPLWSDFTITRTLQECEGGKKCQNVCTQPRWLEIFYLKKKKWLKKFLIQKRQTAVAALELLNKQQTRQRFLEQLWQAEFALCNYKRVRQTQTTAATTPRPSDTDI